MFTKYIKWWYNNNGDDMKKIIVLILVFMLTGCFNKQKVMTCKSNIKNESQNYEASIIYKVYYKNNTVVKTIINETYTSQDKDMLDYFEQSLKITYDNFNILYKGYSYSYKIKENSITFNTTIDYNELDLKSMIKDSKISKDYVRENNTLSISGAKNMYEDKGASCEGY